MKDFLDLIAFRYDFVRIVFVSDGCSLEDLIHKLFVYIFVGFYFAMLQVYYGTHREWPGGMGVLVEYYIGRLNAHCSPVYNVY